MKLNPTILTFVVIAALYVGFQINEDNESDSQSEEAYTIETKEETIEETDETNDSQAKETNENRQAKSEETAEKSATETKSVKATETKEKKAKETKKSTQSEEKVKKEEIKSSGLTPEYFEKYLSENGFTMSPVFNGKMSDIYTGKMKVGDTEALIQVDIYHDRKKKEVLLVEVTIDGSYYVSHPNQKKAEELVNKIADSFYVTFAGIPYKTSSPEEAQEWVKSHIHDSYAVEPKEKTSKEFGLATMNIYGNPLMRFLEIDFGYSDSFPN
jgi:hypothetical protein